MTVDIVYAGAGAGAPEVDVYVVAAQQNMSQNSMGLLHTGCFGPNDG